MAVLADVLPVVSRCSRLASKLYRLSTGSLQDSETIAKIARVITGFAATLKQLGTLIKNDDRLPSHEAFHVFADILQQAQSACKEIEAQLSLDPHGRLDEKPSQDFYQPHITPWNTNTNARLLYLTAHLEVLRATLCVLLQVLYTSQSMIWAKLRPTVSPQQAAIVVEDERIQLETFVLEQQTAILFAKKVHAEINLGDHNVLSQVEMSRSLVSVTPTDELSPVNICNYLDQRFASINVQNTTKSDWFPLLDDSSMSQAERLLALWTILPQFQQQLLDAERELKTQKRETQQPTVESDSEDDQLSHTKLAGSGAKMTSTKHQNNNETQPLFTEVTSPSILSPENSYGPTEPPSPAISHRSSYTSLRLLANEQESPVSSQSNTASLPIQAAAAIEAKEGDSELDLEIPWTLRTRRYYWKYIDGKITSSNSDHDPSVAFRERNSWTEIMASWACKEAIREAGFRVVQVQKEAQDGRRTRFETCFLIEHPLNFEQVRQIVERTVEMYRQNQSPRRSRRDQSMSRQPPPSLRLSTAESIDRDKTPVPRRPSTHLERSSSSMPHRSLVAPPLDRSSSMPGKGATWPIPQIPLNGLPSQPHLSIPGAPVYIQQSIHPPAPQPASYANKRQSYPPQTPKHPPPPSPSLHQQPRLNNEASSRQPPSRQSTRNRLDDLTSSESEASMRSHSRRHRSQSRSRSRSRERERERVKNRNRERERSRYPSSKRRSHGASKAVGALMGIGGLTALLDGLSGL